MIIRAIKSFLRIFFSFDDLLCRNINWRYNKRSILGYVLRTFLIFSALFCFCLAAGFYFRMLPGLILGGVLFVKRKKAGGKFWTNLITALIVAGILILFTESLIFASVMVIFLGMPVYLIESFLDTYHIQEDRVEQHHLNPYPKWAVFFGIFMILLNLTLFAVSFSGISVPEVVKSSYSPAKSELSQLEKGDRVPGSIDDSRIEEFRRASLENKNGGNRIEKIEKDQGLASQFFGKASHWKESFLGEVFDAWNWFVFCIVISIYATPSEIREWLSTFGGAGGGSGQGVSTASTVYILQDLFFWVKGLFTKGKKQ